MTSKSIPRTITCGKCGVPWQYTGHSLTPTCPRCHYRQKKTSVDPDASPVKVGLLFSTSGPMQWVEESMRNATEMAIEELNNSGGLLGRQILPVRRGGASDPDTFKRQAEELISEKVCSIFGCYDSRGRKAVIQALDNKADQGESNLLWYATHYEGYEKVRTKSVIYSGPTGNQQILPAVRWCLEQGWNRILLVGSDYVFPRVTNELIRTFLAQSPVTLITSKGEDHPGADIPGEDFYVKLEATDFTEVLNAIKNHMIGKTGNIILNTLNGDCQLAFFRQLHETLSKEGFSSSRVPVMSLSLPESKIAPIGTEYMKGHYIAASYFNAVDTNENSKFRAEYSRRYPWAGITDDAAEAAYSLVHLFAEAAARAGRNNPLDIDDPVAIREAALGLSYLAPGGLVKIDPDNQHCWRISRIGKINEEGKIDPEDIKWSSEDMMYPVPYPRGIRYKRVKEYGVEPEHIGSMERRDAALNETVNPEEATEELKAVESSSTGI